MPETDLHKHFLSTTSVEPAVFELRPDDRVLLLGIDGLEAAPSNPASDKLVDAAQAHARKLLTESTVEELPHIAAWREAYRALDPTTDEALAAAVTLLSAGLKFVTPDVKVSQRLVSAQ